MKMAEPKKLYYFFNLAPVLRPFTFDTDIEATAACKVQDGETPISFTWLKDGKNVNIDENVKLFYFSPREHWIWIQKVQSHHLGNYTCTATNIRGQHTQTAELRFFGKIK